MEDISFSELVAIVHVQKSTEMALTVDIAEALFRAIDADNSGWIDLQELRDSLRDPDIVELLEEMNQPVLTSMIKKKVERKCLGGKQTADPVEESFMKIAMADGKFEKERQTSHKHQRIFEVAPRTPRGEASLLQAHVSSLTEGFLWHRVR